MCVALETASEYCLSFERSCSSSPSKRRLTSINSIGVLPTRSPRAKRSRVDLIGAGGNRGERIRDGKPAIVVTVPIHANFFAGRLHDFCDYEIHQIVGAARGGVADRVAQNDGARPGTNRGGIKVIDRRGIGANRVLGDVHHRQPGGGSEFHGFFGVRCR